jgi:hypothetical protein
MPARMKTTAAATTAAGLQELDLYRQVRARLKTEPALASYQAGGGACS